jgi:uncharacterized protein Smg (DUF494 family)
MLTHDKSSHGLWPGELKIVVCKYTIRFYSNLYIFQTHIWTGLLFMENMGQIDANQREMIIDQIMSLGDSTISLDDLRLKGVLLRQCRQFLETHLALLLQTDNQTYKSVHQEYYYLS